MEKIARNALKLIKNQINLEKLEIQQNQTKMERLSFHNSDRSKIKKSCRFWTGKLNDQSKNKNLIREHDFRKKILHKVQTKKRSQNNDKFYGLAKSGKAKNQITTQNNNRLYQSKYAQVDSYKDENIEFKPTKMTSLVTKPKNENDVLLSPSSEFEKETDVKLQRLGAIKKIKGDENNKKRDRRMFNFMQQHLLKAQKEHKFKKNTTLKLIHIAKELREKQGKFVQKKFKEHQIEKYFKRTEQRKRKIKHLEWIYAHNENILLANKMKTDFLEYCDFLNTKSEPTIFFRPNMEENILQKVYKKEIISSSSRLRIILEQRLKILLETEGKCPTDPDSLIFTNDLCTFHHIGKENY